MGAECREPLSRIGAGPVRTLLRADATWDHLVYEGAPQMQDRGCEYHPSCLTCPFERCRFDPDGNVVMVRTMEKRRRARELRAAGQNVDLIAESLGCSRRSVFRLLAG